MKFAGKFALLLAIGFVSFTQVGGCGGGGGGSSSGGGSTSNTYAGTQSPGDYWTWTIDTAVGTFSATNNMTLDSYSGTAELLPSGYLKLTVTAGTGVSVGSVGYAMEFPGVAVLVKPADADGALIIGAIQGTTPSPATYNYNWVIVPGTGWDKDDDTAYGTAEVVIDSSNVMDANVQNIFLNGTNNGTPVLTEDFVFVDGIATHATEPATIIATPSGVFIADMGPSPGAEAGFAGMLQPGSTVSHDMSGKEFRGFVFKKDSVGADDTIPIWVTGFNGGVTGGEWTDLEAGDKDVVAVSIAFDTQTTPGIIEATLTNQVGPPDTYQFVFMVTEIAGKTFGFGIGDDSDAPYNVLFIEQ